MHAAQLLVLGLACAVGACSRAPGPLARYDVAPAPEDWGPHPGAPMEWWYVGGVAAPASEGALPPLAFHAAFFRAPIPPEQRWLGLRVAALLPCAYSLAEVRVTDLETGERYAWTTSDLPGAWACVRGPPLRLRLGRLALEERGSGVFRLLAGPLALTLRACTPRVVHPPGWSGGAGLGTLAYQSIPCLSFAGSWRGQAVRGQAWLDHQWGDQIPGRDARWDWHGVHLDDGSHVMLYRVTRMDGSGTVLQGSRTRPDGSIHALVDLVTEPVGTWRGARGRCYATTWRARAADLDLLLTPLRPDQEVESLSGVTYWEGAVHARGTADGRPVTGWGLGEHFPLPRGQP